MFLQRLRHQYFKMLTTDTISTTHVQLFAFFWTLVLHQRAELFQVASHFDITDVNAIAL